MQKIIYKILWDALYAGICSLSVFWSGLFIPRRWFNPDNFWFSPRKWENEGKIYNKVFVSKWKAILPDMSKYARRLISKSLTNVETEDDVKSLILETCVAEAAHCALFILAFGMIVIWKDTVSVICAVCYAFGNVPYIIIQRYNRPRLKKMLKRMTRTREREARLCES